MSEALTRIATLGIGAVEYRIDRRGDSVVVVLHGGHMRASLRLGEDDLADLGCTVLVPSRPGYGATPLATGRSPEGFADVVRELCEHLGITRITAVVGISGGGPTAVALAARHPDLVQRLILESAVGSLPWPDRRTRIGGIMVFNGVTERVTWAAVRSMVRVAPTLTLRALLSGLSTRPAGSVVAALDDDSRSTLVELFSRMRSGRGFRNDLHYLRHPRTDLLSRVDQKSLVVASRHDAAIPLVHAETLTAHLPHAQLVVSEADSHFLWLGSDRVAISNKIRDFLADT